MFLTLEQVTEALILLSQEAGGEPMDNAREIADLIIGFFGYGDRIIDNVLLPKDRDVFYQLENLGLLRTSQEETTLPDGRDWRVHYWFFNMEKINELKAGQGRTEEYEDPSSYSVYELIPADVWNRTEAEA
jgi:hypothetical protein